VVCHPLNQGTMDLLHLSQGRLERANLKRREICHWGGSGAKLFRDLLAAKVSGSEAGSKGGGVGS